jgi:hypothetical protein
LGGVGLPAGSTGPLVLAYWRSAGALRWVPVRVASRRRGAVWRAQPRVVGVARRGSSSFTVSKLECLKQPLGALNTLAWDNGIGLWFYFVGF